MRAKWRCRGGTEVHCHRCSRLITDYYAVGTKHSEIYQYHCDRCVTSYMFESAEIYITHVATDGRRFEDYYWSEYTNFTFRDSNTLPLRPSKEKI